MRILVVTPTYLPIIGGAETAIFEIFRRLATRHEVRILTPHISRRDIADWGAVDQILNDSGTPVHRFHDVLTTGKGAAKRLWEKWIPPLSLSYLPPFIREVISFRPDIVNLHYLFPAAPLLSCARWLGIPTVLSLVGRSDVFGVENRLFRYHRRTMEKAVGKADQATALSRYMVEGLANQQELRIIPYGADIERYNPVVDGSRLRELLEIPRNALVLFSLQRLAPVKRVDLIIQAFLLVRKSAPNARLILGGKGPEEGNLKLLASRLGLEDAITFAGYIPEQELPTYLAAADLFTFSSESETFGIVLAQAMAAGKPVVAVRSSCIEEVVTHEQDGLLVPPDNADAFAEAILALLLAPIRRKQLAENARHKAVQRYGWDAIALEYEQLLTEVTAKGAGGVVQPSSQSAAGY